MTISQSWCSALVLLLLFLVAACGGKEEPAAPSEEPEVVESAATTITVTIGSDGTFAPNSIAPNPGDTVSFVASGGDAVLCVDPASLFGGDRYPIVNGTNLDLMVQSSAVHVDFGYIACLGNLNMSCGDCREGVRGTEGGGRTGP